MLDFMTKAVATINSWGNWGIAVYCILAVLLVAGVIGNVVGITKLIRRK